MIWKVKEFNAPALTTIFYLLNIKGRQEVRGAGGRKDGMNDPTTSSSSGILGDGACRAIIIMHYSQLCIIPHKPLR